MIDEIVLDIDGLEIPVSVIRKRVKNLNLRVRADGTVTLSIPQHLPLARAHEFLERRGNWIAERVHRNIERRPSLDFVGELPDRIPLWGKLVPLDTVRTDRGQGSDGQVTPGQASVNQVAPGQAAPGQVAPGRTAIDQIAIDELYRTEVLRALPDVAKRMEARIGVHATRWSVRTMKTRWGSCTPKTGAIRINARLAAYPAECLEFVVAHELVHLLEPSHNARFHALLDEFFPDNRRLAKLLRKAPVLD